ncbi:MAG: radical SAM protein [Desulfovibrionales bacterium]
MGKSPRPTLVYADKKGNIYDDPELLMLCRQGNEIGLPKPDELIPLPPESDLYLLPQRKALGLDPQTGKIESAPFSAVAAFVCPGYTLSAVTAYISEENAESLPLFSYAAVGYARGQFWVTAKKVDMDTRQVFCNINPQKIEKGAKRLLKKFPDNRLVQHLTHCALTYSCPAAKNLALGRFECPLPTARTCNARCVGCISKQDEESGFSSPQNRITFRPAQEEIVQIMSEHAAREKKAIFSFGQGCEGEPLTETKLLASSVKKYRRHGGWGTVNVNTNASLPESMDELAYAGFNSIRVSLNSAREDVYNLYYRPKSYSFADVLESMRRAKEKKLFISLNYLFFPGINDTEQELSALSRLVLDFDVDLIQMRNLNLDPELYIDLMRDQNRTGGRMGLKNFMRRLKMACPKIRFGYFNPYLGQ